MNSSWNVGGAANASSSPSKEKIPYIPQQKSNENMTDGQKEFIRQYNLMRTTLLNNGLMEKKD